MIYMICSTFENETCANGEGQEVHQESGGHRGRLAQPGETQRQQRHHRHHRHPRALQQYSQLQGLDASSSLQLHMN